MPRMRQRERIKKGGEADTNLSQPFSNTGLNEAIMRTAMNDVQYQPCPQAQIYVSHTSRLIRPTARFSSSTSFRGAFFSLSTSEVEGATVATVELVSDSELVPFIFSSKTS